MKTPYQQRLQGEARPNQEGCEGRGKGQYRDSSRKRAASLHGASEKGRESHLFAGGRKGKAELCSREIREENRRAKRPATYFNNSKRRKRESLLYPARPLRKKEGLCLSKTGDLSIIFGCKAGKKGRGLFLYLLPARQGEDKEGTPGVTDVDLERSASLEVRRKGKHSFQARARKGSLQ